MEDITQAFFEAVKKGRRQEVEEMLSIEPGLVNSRDASGFSPVLTAIYYQANEIADLLIERGSELTIFEACAAGQTEQARRLIEQDAAQVNAFSPDGFQPLGLASFFGHASVAELLLANGAEVNTPSRNGMRVQPINSAAAGQHLEIVRMLLDKGADPNARQGEDFVPLHAAAQNGQPEMVRLLLEHGANPHAATTEGVTPLDLAKQNGNEAVVALLQNTSN